MPKGIHWFSLLFITMAIYGCHYRKGSTYTWTETGDSIRYVIIATGRGEHMSDKIARLLAIHADKGDNCQVFYLSGPLENNRKKYILLFHSVLPDMEKDMLTKGFMGTFTTRQSITCLVVSREDLHRFLLPAKK